jgi:hypothetical protein
MKHKINLRKYQQEVKVATIARKRFPENIAEVLTNGIEKISGLFGFKK